MCAIFLLVIKPSPTTGVSWRPRCAESSSFLEYHLIQTPPREPVRAVLQAPGRGPPGAGRSPPHPWGTYSGSDSARRALQLAMAAPGRGSRSSSPLSDQKQVQTEETEERPGGPAILGGGVRAPRLSTSIRAVFRPQSVLCMNWSWRWREPLRPQRFFLDFQYLEGSCANGASGELGLIRSSVAQRQCLLLVYHSTSGGGGVAMQGWALRHGSGAEQGHGSPGVQSCGR